MLHRHLTLSSMLLVLAIGALACGGSGSETPPPVEPTTPTRPETEAVRRAEPETTTPEDGEPSETPSEEEAAPDPESESSE